MSRTFESALGRVMFHEQQQIYSAEKRNTVDRTNTDYS